MSQELDIHKLQHASAKSKSKSKPLSERNQLSDAFVKEYLSMIEAIAANVVGSGKMPPGIEFADLVSWGVEGLIKAYHNFDETKGSQLKTYAFYRIRGEIFDKIRTEWRYRNPNEYKSQRAINKERIADLAEAALDQLEQCSPDKIKEGLDRIVENSAVVCLMSLENIDIVSEMEGTKDPQLEHFDEKSNTLWEEIHTLDDEEQKLVELFYVHGFKQKEIAKQLNLSRSTISRMHMKILEKLRKKLKGKI
ncbi:MAG: sigma-70 family RNA polymerase sigma factor [Candidatus Margulisbacteria bacterium]|nr:sigma-70 family RNA polymerase sigma factor [Candidatus Margulisiibacteriota bacterium]